MKIGSHVALAYRIIIGSHIFEARQKYVGLDNHNTSISLKLVADLDLAATCPDVVQRRN